VGIPLTQVIPQIAPVGRCIAPDYLGFGRSDKPVAREWYSYDTHAASSSGSSTLDLRDVTVVMQDWGGRLACVSRWSGPTGSRARRHEHGHLLRAAAVGHVAALPRARPP
jgi:pimeloyl-ACP methyl ester carboxylesterase